LESGSEDLAVQKDLTGLVKSSWSNMLGAGRFHITAIAAVGNLTFGWLFTGQYQWFLMAVCALDWFIVNLTNRVVDYEEDQINRITAAEFVHQKRLLFLGLGYGTLLASLVLLHFVNPAVTLFRIAFHGLGLVYNWPLLPGRRRLKQAYFFKNTASAAGFLITLFCYPLATLYWNRGAFIFPAGIQAATVALTAVFFFLFELSYEVIYDLRDVAGDRQAGVRTYPVVHGERITGRIIDGLLLISVMILMGGYLVRIIPWRILIMIFAPGIQYFLYKRFMRRGITSRDCIRLTWLGTAMLTIYNLWAAAGLPGAEL